MVSLKNVLNNIEFVFKSLCVAGIYTEEECDSKTFGARTMIIVGYNAVEKYWIVKNRSGRQLFIQIIVLLAMKDTRTNTLKRASDYQLYRQKLANSLTSDTPDKQLLV